jgi:hypothetical protein
VLCCLAGANQQAITRFLDEGSSGQPPPTFDKPPPFGSKVDAALYTPSAPWLTDVFLQSTEKERE